MLEKQTLQLLRPIELFLIAAVLDCTDERNLNKVSNQFAIHICLEFFENLLRIHTMSKNAKVHRNHLSPEMHMQFQ